MAGPFTNKSLKRVGKNAQTLWWAELDLLHSMTRAHPPQELNAKYKLGYVKRGSTAFKVQKGRLWRPERSEGATRS